MVSVPAASVAGTFFFRAKPPSREVFRTREKARISTNDFNAKKKSGHLRKSVLSVGKINRKKLCVLASLCEIFTSFREHFAFPRCRFVSLAFYFEKLLSGASLSETILHSDGSCRRGFEKTPPSLAKIFACSAEPP